MNLFTHVRQIPALQMHLWASCYKRSGFRNASVSVIGLPTGRMLPVIRELISEAKDIPFSDKGGARALMQKEGYGSYLMNFGTLTEQSTEEWMKMCRNHFSDSGKTLLRQPGREFTLVGGENETWYLKPVSYNKHKVEDINHPTSKWTIRNEFSEQPLRLRIEPLMSVKPFNDPSGIVIADFDHPESFTREGNADGVEGDLTAAREKFPGTGGTGRFSASVSGVPARKGLWPRMEKKFEPGLNLSNISYRVGKKQLFFDSVNEKVMNQEEANILSEGHYRPKYEIPEII